MPVPFFRPRFDYDYVGLPGLEGEPFATRENLLGVALSALMRLPADRRVELYAEGLKRLAGAGENDNRQFLLAECLEAYAELDASQKARVQALLYAEAYREVEPLMKTTYERGVEQGERRSALRLMEAKFGPLPPEVNQQNRSRRCRRRRWPDSRSTCSRPNPSRSSAWMAEARVVRRRRAAGRLGRPGEGLTCPS